mgnify:CR=1 FL=1
MLKAKVIDKKTIIRGLRFTVIVSLIFSTAIIFFTIDLEALDKLIDKIKYRYLFYMLLAMIGNWLFAGLRLKLLVSTIGDYISLLDSIIVYLGGSFVSFVTPFASGGGPYQVYFLHKKGVNVGKSSTVIVIQFVLRLFFFGTLTPVFFIFFNNSISAGAIPNYIFYLAFGMGMLISVAIIILTLIPEVMDKLINLILSIKKLNNFIKNNYKAKKYLVKSRRELREFRESLLILSKNKLRLFVASFYTIIYWSLIFMIMPLILKGMGLEPNFFKAYVMQTIIYLILPYMPTPGASGVAEVGFASLFVAFIPKSIVGIVTFGWRLYTFYLILLVGGTIAIYEINRKTGDQKNE